MFLLRSLLTGLLAVSWMLACSPARALDGETVFDKMVAYIAADQGCGEAGRWPGWERRVVPIPRDGYRLRYSRFGCAPGDRGALVISPGRSEPSYEYAETAIDFIARGFGPVYVVDHRGQGLSPRLLADLSKGHIEHFPDYIKDFAVFVDAVQADLASLGAPDAPLFLTSNSMGGAIAIGYFQMTGADNPFRAAALVSAMIHVNYISYTDKDPSWLNLKIYSESGVSLQGWWRCEVATLWDADRCDGYAAPATFGSYQTDQRGFRSGAEVMMTQSRDRYDLRTYMWDRFDWSTIRDAEYAGERWTGPQIGGSTTRWTRESVRFLRKMRKSRNLARMVHVPILLLSGTRDLRAYRPYAGWMDAPPDLSRHVTFCDRLNAASLAARGIYICDFVALNGAFHEMYKERDEERQKALDTVDSFLARHAD